jgi:hypothetical protein
MRKRKTNQIISKIALILILIFSITQLPQNTPNSTKGGLPSYFYQGEDFSWEIKNVTSNVMEWYNFTTFALMGKWQANIGEFITWNVTDFTTISGKEYLIGTLEIGNYSLTTNDYNIGNNLILSVYPWIGGLISLEISWEELKNVAPFNQTDVTITTNQIINFHGKETAVVKITNNAVGQYTELIYEKTTGILLTSKANFGDYFHEIVLNQTTVPLAVVTNNISALNPLAVTTALLFISSVLALRKKKTGK